MWLDLTGVKPSRMTDYHNVPVSSARTERKFDTFDHSWRGYPFNFSYTLYMYLPVTDWKYDVILKKEVNPSRPGLYSSMELFRSTAAVINHKKINHIIIIIKLVMRN